MVVGFVVALGACSGTGSSSSATSTTVASADDGFPVTIEHWLGEATVTARPERVVALGPADEDIALALGVTPVAMTENAGIDGGISPWLVDAFDLDGVEILPADLTGAPVEQLLDLDPDLVLATTATADPDDAETVARFDVPVIAPLRGPVQDTWDELTLAIGRALGETDQAEDLVEEVQAEIDDVAASLPELEGKTVVVGAANAPGIVRVVNRPTDTAARLLAELGLRLPPALEAIENPTPVGATDLSWEQVDLLDADVVLLADTGALHDELTSLDAFGQLPAVQRGSYVAYEPAVAAGLRVPTPLSIPYVLDAIAPALEAAAASTP